MSWCYHRLNAIISFLLVAVLWDNLSTALCLRQLGSLAYEANPISRFLFALIGAELALLLNFLIIVPFVLILRRKILQYQLPIIPELLFLLALVRTAAATSNTVMLIATVSLSA